MKNFAVLMVLACLSVALIQCTAKKAATSNTSSAAIVDELKKTYTDAQMQEGKVIWQQKCGKCHELPQPQDYTVSKMDRILPNMSMRSKLNEEQSGKVRAYLLTHAKL